LAVSYYSATLAKFASHSRMEILGELTRNHRHDLEHQQRGAWLTQVDVLKEQLAGFPDGHIHFEFIIPRMGKRADCVLLLAGIVFVLEFKVNSRSFDRYAVDQAHDYALDLKNFHRGSHNAPVVPVLVATKSSAIATDVIYAADHVAAPIQTGSAGIHAAIQGVLGFTNAPNLDPYEWAASGYQPTPTIIEAAQALYQSHDVQEIARSDAGAKNLQATDACIAETIEHSKSVGRKSICFITGVPGAGKTLAGLNIAAKRASKHVDEHAVFLSGNGPLVDVLREALARDQANREGIKKSDAQRKVRSFVQNIHHFRDEYLQDQNAPIEKVVVFDEAQRAWTKEQASKFMQTRRGHTGFSQSEPEFLISVMDRHSDWCTIVCLIGGGQEINTGEAGLLEWLTALQERFHDWDVHASALLDDQHYTVAPEAIRLLRNDRVTKHPDLHLSVSMRSFRAERLSAFVGAVLDGNAEDAKQLFIELNGRYPIWLTRDLEKTRGWLRAVSRGSERFGLVASSGAHRLRPEGIHIKSSIDPSSWFLNDRSDVRSSFYLEDVATEFDIQGLELDWVGVCWDADLRYGSSNWEAHAFRGTKWQNVRRDERKLYLTNAYRVLLTRARQGMVIFVPEGDNADPTRPKEFYDGTYKFLQRCGLPIAVPRIISTSVNDGDNFHEIL
jgi:hypothetical protein